MVQGTRMGTATVVVVCSGETKGAQWSDTAAGRLRVLTTSALNQSDPSTNTLPWSQRASNGQLSK